MRNKYCNYTEIMTRYNQLQADERNELPEEHPEKEALLKEMSDNLGDIVQAYFFSYVEPGQLPGWVERMFVSTDFTNDEWDIIMAEVTQRAKATK
ncbi:hypothetical protein JUJ52_10375 [Virgibacillus sp. AGTR]|uniref:hypothetical protein n=1 Tax=Virgibacillus sp. AGTR TaxID=2812055 RepID=UPI001D16E1A5|nr:hypothetical protein [Virgibacillus sp. AGTR]MCC2250370.1 hypothetical protein [Virgibacillus sp. AGTR]